MMVISYLTDEHNLELLKQALLEAVRSIKELTIEESGH